MRVRLVPEVENGEHCMPITHFLAYFGPILFIFLLVRGEKAEGENAFARFSQCSITVTQVSCFRTFISAFNLINIFYIKTNWMNRICNPDLRKLNINVRYIRGQPSWFMLHCKWKGQYVELSWDKCKHEFWFAFSCARWPYFGNKFENLTHWLLDMEYGWVFFILLFGQEKKRYKIECWYKVHSIVQVCFAY